MTKDRNLALVRERAAQVESLRRDIARALAAFDSAVVGAATADEPATRAEIATAAGRTPARISQIVQKGEGRP